MRRRQISPEYLRTISKAFEPDREGFKKDVASNGFS
jgi:hypothetical protein